MILYKSSIMLSFGMFAMFVDSLKCDPQLATRCAQNATCSVSQREYQCEYKTGSDN